MLNIIPLRSPRPHPDYGDLFTVKEFVDSVMCGLFNDYDGSLELADEKNTYTDMISVSSFMSLYEQGILEASGIFTHVLWFNK